MYFCDAQELQQFTEWLNLQDDIGEPVEPLGNLIRRVQRKAAAARELTLKQRTFAREYAHTRNATQSAITAGYSAHTAQQIGYKLTKHPKVIELVDHEAGQIMAIEESQPVSAAMIWDLQRADFVSTQIRRLVNIIDCDAIEALEAVRSGDELPQRVKDAVLSVRRLRNGTTRIVMRDKLNALAAVLKMTTANSACQLFSNDGFA